MSKIEGSVGPAGLGFGPDAQLIIQNPATASSFSLQNAIDECVDDKGDVIQIARGYQSPSATVNFNKTPFGRAVEAKVIASKEAKSLVEAEAKLKGLKDTVMLAGFPGELTELFQVQLPAATDKFRRLAGLPDTPKQLTT